MKARYFVMAALFVILALVISGAVFLLRAPVLMVTDAPLTALYGTSRARSKQAELSFKLFRRFVPVMVSESAGPDIIVAAVKAAAKEPQAVLFPYHYAASAQRYKDEQPEIPVVIFGGRQQTDSLYEASLYISTDTEADLFKAGIIAAFLSADRVGIIVVFYDGYFSLSLREAFEKGLMAQGVSGNALYIENNAEFSYWEDISCAVAIGRGNKLFEKSRDIPAILFSWIEPEITPTNVKVIFSDSPWSQAYEALKIMGNEEKTLASEIIFPGKRIPEKKALSKELARQNSQTSANGEDL